MRLCAELCRQPEVSDPPKYMSRGDAMKAIEAYSYAVLQRVALGLVAQHAIG